LLGSLVLWGLVVVLVYRFRSCGADPPVEIILNLADREQAVELVALEGFERLLDIRGFADRRGRLQCHDTLERAELAVERVERMQPGRLRGIEIAGDGIGAADADGACRFGYRQDLAAVGGDGDDIDAAGGCG